MQFEKMNEIIIKDLCEGLLYAVELLRLNLVQHGQPQSTKYVSKWDTINNPTVFIS